MNSKDEAHLPPDQDLHLNDSVISESESFLSSSDSSPSRQKVAKISYEQVQNQPTFKQKGSALIYVQQQQKKINPLFLKQRTQNDQELSRKVDRLEKMENERLENSQHDSQFGLTAVSKRKFQENTFQILSQHSRSSGLKNKLIGNVQQNQNDSDISSNMLTFDPNKFQNLPRIQDILKNQPTKLGSLNVSSNDINQANGQSYSFKKQNTFHSRKGVSSRYNETEEEEQFQGAISAPNTTQTRGPVNQQIVFGGIQIQDQIIYEDQNEQRENRNMFDYDISPASQTNQSKDQNFTSELNKFTQRQLQEQSKNQQQQNIQQEQQQKFIKMNTLQQIPDPDQQQEKDKSGGRINSKKDLLEKYGINENDLYLNSNIDSLKKSKEFRQLKKLTTKLNMSETSKWQSSSDEEKKKIYPSSGVSTSSKNKKSKPREKETSIQENNEESKHTSARKKIQATKPIEQLQAKKPLNILKKQTTQNFAMKKNKYHIKSFSESSKSQKSTIKDEVSKSKESVSNSKKVDVNYIGMSQDIIGRGLQEPSLEMSDQVSDDSQTSSDEIIDVIGSGILNEVCQQRGDEDSRRYRVFQHYLRTSGQNDKKKAAHKHNFDEDNDHEELSFSSSSENCHDTTHLEKSKSKLKQIQQKIIEVKRQESINIKTEVQPLSHKQEFQKRRYVNANINEQKDILKKMQRTSDPDKKKELKDQLLDLQEQMKLHEQQPIGKQKQQKHEHDENESTMMFQGSDEEQFYDQTIQLIAQNTEANKDIFLFNPDSTGKAAWEVAGLFFIIYQSIFIPFRICFAAEAEGASLYIETTIDICFMLDVLVQFNTGFYKKGNLINSRKLIIQNYVQSWFFIDIVASFPYEWVTSGIQNDDGEESNNVDALSKTPQLLKLMKMARFLRFLRLLRVLKLKQILYRIEELIMNDAFVATLNLLKVVAVVIFIGHWIACIFYAIGAAEYQENYDCWLTNANLQDSDVDEKYISSLYWAFATMTTVGYGDIYPITNREKLFAMLSMLVACGVFAYVVGSIETIVRRSNTIESQFKEKILHINQYLMHKKVPKYLIRQVRRYLEQMQEHKKKEKLDQKQVLSMLNKNLQDEVLIHIIGKMIRKTKIFLQIFDQRLQSEIIFMLKQQIFLMDDLIFEEGDKQDRIYDDAEIINGQFINNADDDTKEKQGQGLFFIIQGGIIILQKETKTYIKDLTVGNIFGEIGFFSGQPRTITAKSRGFSELMYLNQAEFIKNIHKKHSHTVNTYEYIRFKLHQNPSDYSPLFIKCYRCHQKGHIATQCEFFSEIKGNLIKKKAINLDTIKENEAQRIEQEKKEILDQFKKMDSQESFSQSISSKEELDISRESQDSIMTQTEIDSSDIQNSQNDENISQFENNMQSQSELQDRSPNVLQMMKGRTSSKPSENYTSPGFKISMGMQGDECIDVDSQKLKEGGQATMSKQKYPQSYEGFAKDYSKNQIESTSQKNRRRPKRNISIRRISSQGGQENIEADTKSPPVQRSDLHSRQSSLLGDHTILSKFYQESSNSSFKDLKFIPKNISKVNIFNKSQSKGSNSSNTPKNDILKVPKKLKRDQIELMDQNPGQFPEYLECISRRKNMKRVTTIEVTKLDKQDI